jgi:hypothetical protein
VPSKDYSYDALDNMNEVKEGDILWMVYTPQFKHFMYMVVHKIAQDMSWLN